VQQLGGVQCEALPQLVASRGGERVEHVAGPQQQPHGHHVGVGVVVDPRFGRARVAGAVLVGAHHAADAEAVAGGVVGRQVGEEAGDLQQGLGAVVGEELPVAGGLVVLPEVVGHGQPDVAL
jgi:hypothetical protein